MVGVAPQVDPAAGGQMAAAPQAGVTVGRGGSLMEVSAGANLSEVIKAINALGADPQDLLSILQAMKAAGALRAELEII
jgi:flagellar P-ring protein precursor FlgI